MSASQRDSVAGHPECHRVGYCPVPPLSLFQSSGPKPFSSIGEAEPALKTSPVGSHQALEPGSWQRPITSPAQPRVPEELGRTLPCWVIPGPQRVAGGLVAKHSTGIRAPRALVPFMPLEKPLQLAKIISGRCSRLKSRIAWAVLKAESGNQTCPACWIIWKRRQAASLRPVSALPGTLCRQVSSTRCVRAGRKQAERKHARFHQDLRRIRTCQKGYAKLFSPVSLPASLLHALPLPLGSTEVSPRTFASESGLAGSAGMVTSTERVSTAMTPTGRPPSLRQGSAPQQGPVPCMLQPHSTRDVPPITSPTGAGHLHAAALAASPPQGWAGAGSPPCAQQYLALPTTTV